MIAPFRRLAWFFGRTRFESDLSDELRFHREQVEADASHAGLDASDARSAARRRLGNQAQIAESAREVWSPPALTGLLQDVRYALRGLARRPGLPSRRRCWRSRVWPRGCRRGGPSRWIPP